MSKTNGALAFLDTETTGLDPDQHEIWEVGLIVDDQEYLWQLPVDLGRADARALDIGRFNERRWTHLPGGHVDSDESLDVYDQKRKDILAGNGSLAHLLYLSELPQFAARFAELTWGRHLVGAVVSFDEERLRKLLRRHGACPGWHYHLIDVEALAVGYLSARAETGEYVAGLQLPWDSRDLSAAAGVDPDGFDQHTALGDARWAKALYEACTGGAA